MTLMKLANTEQNPASLSGQAATNEDKPTSFTDVVTSAWDMTQKNYKTFSKSNLINEIEEERRQIYRDIENSDFPEFEDEDLSNVQQQFATGEYTTLEYFENNVSSKEKARDDFVLQKRAEDPEKYRNLMTSLEIREEARKRARESVDEHERTVKNASGIAGLSGTFIGSAGASMTDVVNIATMPFGAVRGAGILKTFAQEATIQGAVETGIQIPVSQWQAEVGNKYGLGEAATNIMGAGLLGGGIAATVKAAGKAVERGSVMFGLNQNNPRLAKEQRIAANELSKLEAVDEANPSNSFANDISIEHNANVKAINDAYRQNKNFFDMEMKVSDKDFALINPEFKFDTDLQYRAGLQHLPRFQKSVFYDLGSTNLKYTKGTADRFSNYIKVNKLENAIVRPTGKVFNTKKEGQAFIKDLAAKEAEQFPNVTPQVKQLFSIEPVGNKFEMMKFDPNIGLKKNTDDVIMSFPTKKEATENLEGSEYVVKTDKGYSIVQGDGDKIINDNNIGRIKFYDELQKLEKTMDLDENVKVDSDLAPSSIEPLPESKPNTEIKAQIDALNARDNIDTRFSELDTLVDESPNFRVELDEGNSITMKGLKKELDEEKSIIEQMKVCAL